MVKSIIYWHPWIYQLAMMLIYGKEYSKRYLVIAKEAGSMEVLDVCCGDCKLSNYVKKYRGVDFNDEFVKSARKKGLNVAKIDVAKWDMPKSECTVMQDSLYQFMPSHEKLIKKLLRHSKKLIIAECGITLGQAKNPIISAIARKLTNTSRSHEGRFTKKELYALYRKFNAKKIIDTGKDLTAVFEP